MVWAEDETEAISETKRWFQVQHDLGQVWIEEEAQRTGSDHDAGDLGVTESNEAINHGRLSPHGEILSTKFRVEPEHLRRSTRLMRESDRPGWQRVRERLRERGGRSLGSGGREHLGARARSAEPHVARRARAGATILVHSTAYGTLTELDARWFWDRNRALQTAETILDSE